MERFPKLVMPELKSPPPATEKSEEGEVVPMPTLPDWVTKNLLPVLSPTAKVEVAVKCWTVVVPAIKAPPWTERVCEGELVPTPNLPFKVSKVRRLFPMFKALTAEGKVVVAEPVKLMVEAWLKLRKEFPRKIEPVPTCKVPLTCKLFSKVEVPVPPM